jgi:glycosyltransferase involved in cell wall biosynthesis
VHTSPENPASAARSSTPPGEDARLDAPSILVVEDRAHVPAGHFPKRFAELAEGLVAAGAQVEALTSHGWVDDHSTRRFAVVSFPPLASSLATVGIRLLGISQRLSAHLPLWRPAGRALNQSASAVATIATVLAVRSRRRSAHVDGVIVTSWGISPRVLDLLGGDVPWLLLWFTPHDLPARPRGRRRASVGLTMPWRPVASDDDAYPTFELPITTSRDPGTAPFRRPSGGPRRLLVVGSGHPQQHPEVVLDAVRTDPGIQLVIAGRIADTIDVGDIGEWAHPPERHPGHLPMAGLDALFAGCDLVVLSFDPTFDRDSGVLLDAASHARPVIVSSPSAPARLVEAFGAGELFDAGSSTSLLAALARLDLDAASRGAAALAVDRDAGHVARRYLDALESLIPSAATAPPR